MIKSIVLPYILISIGFLVFAFMLFYIILKSAVKNGVLEALEEYYSEDEEE